MSIATALDVALRAAGIPVVGVAIGYVAKRERLNDPVDPADKRRWRVRFTAGATPEQKAAAQAVIDGFDPASVVPERRVDFETAMERLTDDEDEALDAACDADRRLKRWYRRARTRGSINLNDPEVKTALAAVVQAGLFTKARLAELFSG